MPDYHRMHNYHSGTIILRTSGYRFIKRTDGKWEAEHRMVARNSVVHRDLLEGERVFHKNGKREDNAPSNLVVIRFNLEKFKKLPHTRIIFIPVVSRPATMSRSAHLAVGV